jgi:hypothetical protein
MEIHSFGTAQICLNDHVIADSVNDFIAQKYCSEWGESVINKCEVCSQNIKGRPRYISQIRPPFAYFSGPYMKPLFCINCGIPYPWTKIRKEAAFELIQFSEALNPTEKEDLQDSIDDLIANSSKTNVAIVKFKAYAAKAGTEIAKGLRDILIDLVGEQ